MMDGLEGARNLIVRRWGELGGYWGINRTMAEIHALLFVTGEPLCTDDVMDQLKISRGNASMNLRALVDWGLIRRAHKFGDRKEYFEADTDVWSMFETIMRERRRREVEPILATIDRCIRMVSAPNSPVPATDAAHATPTAAEAARFDPAIPADGRPAAHSDAASDSASADALRRRDFRERLEDLRHFLTTMGKLFELMLVFGRDGLDELARSMGTVAGGAASGESAPEAVDHTPHRRSRQRSPARRPAGRAAASVRK